MKVPPARLDSFCTTLPTSVQVVLLFGPDTGAVRWRALQIAKQIVPSGDDPFRITLLTSEAIAAEPSRLFDALAAQALGGGRCLVRVPQAEEKMAAALSQLLQDPPGGDTLLLLEAGELDKRSKLRALAEGDNPAIAALACYPEEGAERARLIAGWLKNHGHGIAGDALELLATITPPDRLALFSELEKLSLYAGQGAALTLGDVQAALGDAAAVDLDMMVLAVADGDRAALDDTLRRLMAENAAPVALLRAAQRHMLRLYETRVRMDGGQSVKDAMGKLQPRVFWKAEAQFAKQVQRWNAEKLQRALAALVEAEAQCKRSGLPDQTLTQQLLFTLARAA